ncbi:hypothetical protein [Tardiphaga sp. 862_B3_N1_1]|uniref:hypothetical protein n=1 Tax=Tardiphaga sp. 862_B3_N1_1 TaxID=3240763 RepID=UPI003F8B4FCC
MFNFGSPDGGLLRGRYAHLMQTRAWAGLQVLSGRAPTGSLSAACEPRVGASCSLSPRSLDPIIDFTVAGFDGQLARAELDRSLHRETIKAICASPGVEMYNVGFTAQPLVKRGDAYRGILYNCLVLLADKMTRLAALNLERRLWSAIAAQDKRTAIYRKCVQSHQVSKYSPSYGGASKERENDLIHGVYIVWWAPYA